MIKRFELYNEGIRDKMSPKSKGEIDRLLEPMFKSVAYELLRLEKHGMGCLGISTYEEAYDFVISKKHRVWRLVDEYGTTEPYKIAINIQHDVRLGREKKLDESIRAKMTPKSEVEIKEIVKGNKMSVSKKITFGLTNDFGWLVQQGLSEISDLSDNHLKLLSIKFGPSKIYPQKLYPQYVKDAIKKEMSNRGFEPSDSIWTPLDSIMLGEGVRDKMTPKSEDNIKKELEDLSPDKRYDKLYREYDGWILDFLSQTEYETLLHSLSPKKKLVVGCVEILVWLVKEAIVDGVTKEDIQYGLDELSVEATYWKGINEISTLLIGLGAKPNDLLMDEAASNGDKELLKLIFDTRPLGPVGERIFRVMKTYRVIDGKMTMISEGDKEILNMIREYRRKVKSSRVNESIRDKMTPKSKEDIRDNIKKKLDIDKDIITARFNAPTGDEQWNRFRKLLKNKALKIVPMSNFYLKVTGDIIDVYDFYVNYFNIDTMMALHFMKKELLNEGVRSKMTPKSEEDFDNLTKGLSPQEKFVMGVKKGVLWLVKNGFDGGANPNERLSDSQTPLSHSTTEGYLDVVKYLIEVCKVNPTQQWCGNTPLEWAVLYGHKDIIDYLKSISINESVKDMMTPKSKEEVVDKLRITLNKVLKRTIADCKEEGITLPMDIGQTAVSYTTDEIPIGQVFEEGTDRMGMGTLTLNPFIKEVMEELLVKYFPKWNEKNIKAFWIGFEEEKEIMYFG